MKRLLSSISCDHFVTPAGDLRKYSWRSSR